MGSGLSAQNPTPGSCKTGYFKGVTSNSNLHDNLNNVYITTQLVYHCDDGTDISNGDPSSNTSTTDLGCDSGRIKSITYNDQFGTHAANMINEIVCSDGTKKTTAVNCGDGGKFCSTIDCPDGQVLSGINADATKKGYLSAIKPVCKAMLPTVNVPVIPKPPGIKWIYVLLFFVVLIVLGIGYWYSMKKDSVSSG